ncbi:DUF6577 family protein [Aestuariivivens sediminis]|uniref:DUF6577 family protein n=1 Tax=Aestuariivivens sediminis TaxID=2913557 RepID=UPI001F581FF2|nr:DUF6577 family protein [Aestuariivivens sediminis]
MTNLELANKIKSNFSDLDIITTHQIAGLIAKFFPDLSDSTISWKLNQLKSDGLINQVGRGLYDFKFKPSYSPNFSLKSKRLYNRIKILTKDEISLWDTQMINKIIGKTIDRYWVFVSTDKTNLDHLFNETVDFSRQVFLHPDQDIINRYLLPQREAIIMSPLVSETPLFYDADYITLSIEGLLVNIWLKYQNYLEPIGYDLNEIFNMAFKKYNINISKLLRYAARRDKRNEISNYIKSIN